MFHGIDERVPVDALRFGVRVLDRFLDLCSEKVFPPGLITVGSARAPATTPLTPQRRQ